MTVLERQGSEYRVASEAGIEGAAASLLLAGFSINVTELFAAAEA